MKETNLLLIHIQDYDNVIKNRNSLVKFNMILIYY